MIGGAWKSWNSIKQKYYCIVEECNDNSSGKYLEYMTEKLSNELSNIWDGKTYLETLLEHLHMICENSDTVISNNIIIGKLRHIFAKISLEKLEPDLVIMDEFQRFKDLLIQGIESEVGMLTNKFFHSNNLRMLLLSATPYKMYSTLEEIDENCNDEHYTEFFNVMNFLINDKSKENNFREIWDNYSIKLNEMTSDDTTIISAKNNAEEALYKIVCRTERVSSKENSGIIDEKDVHKFLEINDKDIRSYLQIKELLDSIDINCNIPIDYVKSSPYLMSFMREYNLKKTIENYFEKHTEEQELKKINKDALWLKRRAFDNYDIIPTNNARLKRVMDVVFQGMERLLWIPPSKPYYEMGGAYKDSTLCSKTLIFSAWEMVPRMLSCLISYEAERKVIGRLGKKYKKRDVHYFGKGKRYPSERMTFSVNDGRPSSMVLFCLLYPSEFLANCYNPVACLSERLGISVIQENIKEKIKKKLDKLPDPKKGQPDANWYFITPFLLDSVEYASYWIENAKEQVNYDDGDNTEKRKKKGLLKHIEFLENLFDETCCEQFKNLGKRPPDLIDVLTDMSIASPSICIYRSYHSYLNDDQDFPIFFPSEIARIFINRMNTVESTAIVDIVYRQKSDNAHWKNFLTYCKDGNLQAVFDEYIHLIASGMDNDDLFIKKIHSHIKISMDIASTQYVIDTYKNFKDRMRGNKEGKTFIRTHYAVAFAKGDGGEKSGDRKKIVRNAFNSPFRPFVIATTSIGQEGLDFHNYCRRIVHWNLPSNPIDIEQREGRINRFKCLAIRQNVAKRYGDIEFKKDVWDEMFQEALREEKTEETSDIIPFWGLREKEDMVKIERIVPMYPFSVDELSYERLIKILYLYRLTLGQPRQEELLEYLFKKIDNVDSLKDLFINLSPFFKDK